MTAQAALMLLIGVSLIGIVVVMTNCIRIQGGPTMLRLIVLPTNIGSETAINPDKVKYVTPYAVGSDLTVISFGHGHQALVKLSFEETMTRLLQP